MNLEEFKEYIINHIAEYLPEEYQGADISILSRTKNNDMVLDGLRIAKDKEQLVPLLYINDAYKAYREGAEIDHVVSALADSYIKAFSIDEDFGLDIPLENIRQYEKIKDRITCRLVNHAANRERLQDKPFTTVEDLAVTYHIQMAEREDGIGSIAITKEMMELYGVDPATLHEQAMTNMEKISPTVIRPIGEILMDLMVPEFMWEHGVSEAEAHKGVETVIPEDVPELLCVTSEKGINGAACILSPDVQQKLAETVGGDYYVLPSSVHEVLVLPKVGGINCAKLQAMVQDVNQRAVAEDERLSDRIYEYNAKNRCFHISDNIQQNKPSEIKPESMVQKYSAKRH